MSLQVLNIYDICCYAVLMVLLLFSPFTASSPANGLVVSNTCRHPGLRLPVAKTVAHFHSYPLTTLTDKYHWIKTEGRKSADVISYFNEEAKYADAVLRETVPLRKKLYDELVTVVTSDTPIDTRTMGVYYYYARIHQGDPYPVYCRKHVNQPDSEEEEETVLDSREIGIRFSSIGSIEAGEQYDIFAFTVDTTGAEDYTIYFKDLTKNRILPDRIPHALNHFKLSNSGNSIIYATNGKYTGKYQVLRHTIGDSSKNDLLLSGHIDLHVKQMVKSNSKQYIFIYSGNNRVPIYYLNIANDINSMLIPLRVPIEGAKYRVYHVGGQFLISLVTSPYSDLVKHNGFYVCKIDKCNDFDHWSNVLGDVDVNKVTDVVVAHKYISVFIRNGPTMLIQTYNLDINGEIGATTSKETRSVYRSFLCHYSCTTIKF
ncbi:peptidase S9A, N-terminal domain-containing protein [Syncephalis plumigaleata]|nr:peptidase S9A, N-terminal domain-containing protein [Syncephalis plumigaleata]